ncbi:hypothetical protein AgCh_015691 [Apium graveolens]
MRNSKATMKLIPWTTKSNKGMASKKTGEIALKGARKGSLFVTDLTSANEDGICCFYTKVEDQNCVKRLRSDNSTEFRNATLTEFCKDKGIVQEFSTARTPQQNGVVERKNRTLVEAA